MSQTDLIADDDSLTFTLIGSERDKGFVRLSDLTDCLIKLQDCIRETERCVTTKRSSLAYIVRKMTVGSPAVGEIAATESKKGRTDNRRIVFAVVRNTFKTLQSGSSRLDPRLDRTAIEKFKNAGEIIQRGGARLNLIVDKIPVTHSFLLAAEKALETQEAAYGSVSGVLEKIDIHDKNAFAIFPPVGGHQVSCTFQDELLPIVQSALRRSVTVYGTMHYIADRLTPLRVTVDDMEVHPPIDDLPSLKAMAGRLSHLSDDSVSLIRKMRDEWDE